MNKTEDFSFDMLALFEVTPDLVCIASKEGYFKKVNPAVPETLGFTMEELFSRPISSFIHPEDFEHTKLTRGELLEGKTLVNFQNRYVTKGGAIVWLQWTSIYLPDKEIVFAIAKNVTETKRKEEEIVTKFNTYKSLASHFKNRAEEDRKFLAHELHEEVAQLAAVLKMKISGFSKNLDMLPVLEKEKLEEAILLSDLLIRTVRRVSFSVSPNMMYDLGLCACLDWESKEFSILNGIPCLFTCNFNETSLPFETKIDFYRISQEALGNIMEHAAATSVKIQLKETHDSISLTITDDGKGFDTKTQPLSAGVLNMQQLALSINGELSVESETGKGTTVAIVLKK